MALSAHPLGWFASTLFVAGLVITAGTSFTFSRLAVAVAAAPVKSTVRPNYVSSLAPAEAADLDIAKFVRVAPAARAPSVVKTPAPPAFTHEVAVDSVWVRSQPSKNSAKVTALERGVRLTVNRTEDGWALVTGRNGGKGWVYTEFLKPASALMANQPDL